MKKTEKPSAVVGPNTDLFEIEFFLWSWLQINYPYKLNLQSGSFAEIGLISPSTVEYKLFI